MGRAMRAVRRENGGFWTFREVNARKRTVRLSIRTVVDAYWRFVITFGGARRAPEVAEKCARSPT